MWLNELWIWGVGGGEPFRSIVEKTERLSDFVADLEQLQGGRLSCIGFRVNRSAIIYIVNYKDMRVITPTTVLPSQIKPLPIIVGII